MRKLRYFLVLLLMVPGCGRHPQATNTGRVEVAPELIATIEHTAGTEADTPANVKVMHALDLHGGKVSDALEFWVDWQGSRVHWNGDAFPVTLRAYEQRLYLAVWDRQKRPFNKDKGMPEPIFRYYAQRGSTFEEIDPSAFPRSIATQNVGFTDRYFMTDRQRDTVQIARDLDPTDIQFRRSMTAKLWCHLATGKQDYESPYTIDQALLETFIRSNQPIKLTLTNYFMETKEAPPNVRDQDAR